MAFETYPNYKIDLPAVPSPHAAPTPPVYNTTAMIQPLMALAEYMSPDARARRKAAVAKANYEYRMYMPGGAAERNALWMYDTKVLARKNAEADLELKQSRLRPGADDADMNNMRRLHGLAPLPKKHDTSPVILNNTSGGASSDDESSIPPDSL